MRLAVLVLVGLTVPAQADERVVLRMAAVAPSGSAWARELVSMSRAIEEKTHGGVSWKWYFDAIAGDETEQGERIRKGQLDGAGSGQILCEHVAPSVRVARLSGVFQNRAEAFDVMNRLQPQFAKEAHENGFVFLGAVGLGPVVIFSREPVASLAELRRYRFWSWDVDEVGIATERAMGIQVVPTPLYEAARAYEQNKTDGYLTVPGAALAFQWSPQVRYVTDLTQSYLWGCLVIAERSFARLTLEQQQAVKSTAAATQARFEDTTEQLDDALLTRLFKRQGLKMVSVSDSFRAQYFAAARFARDKVAEKYVSKEVLDRVLRMLADYRAEHPDANQTR